jgi:hypothetical protein
MACDEFEDSDAQGPKIDPFVVSASNVDLRSLVEVGADHGEHVPARSFLKSFLADSKVDDLDFLGLGAIENILRLDVPVADVAVVQVLDGGDQLLYNDFKLCLIGDAALQEVGLIEALHDQEGAVLAGVQVEGLILDDGRVPKLLQIYEITLQFQNMLRISFLFFCACTDKRRH